MSPKQKISLYGASGILIIGGIGFLLKGVKTPSITLILIGIVLLLMGIGRYTMIKKLLNEHDYDE